MKEGFERGQRGVGWLWFRMWILVLALVEEDRILVLALVEEDHILVLALVEEDHTLVLELAEGDDKLVLQLTKDDDMLALGLLLSQEEVLEVAVEVVRAVVVEEVVGMESEGRA